MAPVSGFAVAGHAVNPSMGARLRPSWPQTVLPQQIHYPVRNKIKCVTENPLDFFCCAMKAQVSGKVVTGPSAAMDGCSRAYMDVLAACPDATLPLSGAN